MSFEPKTWNTGEILPATDMNRIEQGIVYASTSATWAGIADKPTTYAPIIGTTATTAAAGNHSHAFTAITGTATAAQIPSLAASKITSGTFDIARIPTGVTATTVALGNHTHTVATTTASGFMSSADKTKLDGLKGVILATRPTITITDPPDDENLQAAVNEILDYIDRIIGRQA